MKKAAASEGKIALTKILKELKPRPSELKINFERRVVKEVEASIRLTERRWRTDFNRSRWFKVAIESAFNRKVNFYSVVIISIVMRSRSAKLNIL